MKKLALGLVALSLAVLGCESKPPAKPATNVAPAHGAAGAPAAHAAPAKEEMKEEGKTEAAPAAAEGDKKEAAPAATEGDKPEGDKKEGEEKKE